MVTPEQRAVIEAQEGTTLVLAAVGSGKTTTLSRRVARSIELGVAPERVLALTFTNRAARHLRESLERQLGPAPARKALVSTFHGLCAAILRDENALVGLPSGFRILDEEDCEELIRELGVDEKPFALAAEASAVPLGRATIEGWWRADWSSRNWALPYVQALAERGAIDFSGLVMLTRAALRLPEVAERHAARFDSVLVDEVQDTHLSEFEVLAALARRARAFCLVGDLDQTIYSWRGSAPAALVAALEREFAPVRRLHMERNFRCTRRILDLACRVAEGLSQRATYAIPADDLPEGEPVGLHSVESPAAEAHLIADTIRARVIEGAAPERMAVLMRRNLGIDDIAQALAFRGVPCATASQFKFFRRLEVKDALALARLVHRRDDEEAARRVLRRLVKDVNERTAQGLVQRSRELNLLIGDLLDPRTVSAADPYHSLRLDDYVVLDTETTGLDPQSAEVLEVAAVRVEQGQQRLPFEALLLPTGPIGDSEAVHHISAQMLAESGQPPAEVYRRLARYIDGRPIAGHNVVFDRRMIEAHSARLGLPLGLEVGIDSLPLARRMLPLKRFRLGDLVAQLGLSGQATHRALDDVRATISLIEMLRRRALFGADARRAFITLEAPRLARLRDTLDRWSSLRLRPGDLVRRITEEALRHKYPGQPERLDNLAELARRLDRLDDLSLPPEEAIGEAIQRAALVREVDALDEMPGVRILTLHQSKGLEFDDVWLPTLVDGVLPSYMAERESGGEGVDEERRLLYVGITRARRRLDLSWPLRDIRNRANQPSRFLRGLGP